MLSKKAQKIFDMKYRAVPEETWEQACWRIASYVSSAEEDESKKLEYEKKFFELIYNKVFLPGGRILANAGTNIKNLMNCFTLGIEDSREGIYQTLKEAAEIFAWGGGVGFNFSNIREEGAPVLTTGGKASGPMSFMTLFDQTGEVISQASRRGAQIALLDVDHPDIEYFINYKSNLNSRNKRVMDEYQRNLELNSLDKKGVKFFKVLEKTLQEDQLSHFNISVSLSDKFMKAVIEDEDWNLISRVDKSIVKTIKAKELFNLLAKQASKSGDPGVFFSDRSNEDNMVKYLGDIKATNPCVTGDTKVLTVYDGPQTFKDLAEKGDDILVYSWSPETKLPVVRMMRNPRKTRENVRILEIEFDSGLKVKCTPDHNFYVFRGYKVKAEDLIEGQSIRAYAVEIHTDGHRRVHGWVDGKTKHRYTARLVWDAFNQPIGRGMILHHIDFNKLNDRLDNLLPLTISEHNTIHSRHRSDRGYFRGRNHKIVSIKEAGYADVYNGTVDETHTYVIADDKPITGEWTGIVSANCSIYGTLVSTENGLIPVENIKVGDIIATKDSFGKVDNTEHHKKLPVYKVTLSDGSEIIVTRSHQFLSKKNKKDDLIFNSLENLDVGDFISIAPMLMPNNKPHLNKELGFLVGIFIGDGCFTPSILNKNQIAISSRKDDPEWNRIILSSLDKFGFEKIHENRSTNEKSMSYFISGMESIKKFMETFELTPSKSIDKYIPINLINSNKEFLSGLLDGIFSTDGNVNLSSNTHMIRLKTSSKRLAKNIRSILLMFGIHARIYSYFRKPHKIGEREINNTNPYYELIISGDGAEKFKEDIGITRPCKKKKLNLLKNSQINEWTSKIKSIEYFGVGNVADIYESKTDTWIVDGIVNRGCGEIGLLPGEACCLGSLNLISFYDKESNSLNLEFLEYAVRNSVRFLDNVQTLSYTNVEHINDMTKGLRRLGLGVMGWADILAELNIPYGSERSLELAEYLSWFISFFGWLESIELAKEKGPFPLYDKEKVDLHVVEKSLNSKFNPHKFDMNKIKFNGVRNVAVTSIAPTGSISLIADVNSGIEPFFALSYKRHITQGIGNSAKDFIVEVNPILFRVLDEEEFSKEDIEKVLNCISKYGNLSSLGKKFDLIKSRFTTSHEISWERHVETQSIWQKYIDNSISKTINLDKNSTDDDIKNAFLYLWNLGCKGGTVYVDKSREFQILNTGI